MNRNPQFLRRTDVIVDYQGEQFIIEMKIWRGNEYNKRGERRRSRRLWCSGMEYRFISVKMTMFTIVILRWRQHDTELNQ
ncbi:MAG: hypothetical protein K2I96_13690 [Lachnospiraceae bacterium]|nr:hypothetical protein [Lachnospiraceae bacterium]